MSLKKLDEVRADKGFRLWDILVYGVLALIITAIFLSVFLTRDRGKLEGFQVYAGNEIVYSYSFDDGEIRRGEGVEAEDTERGFKLTVRTDGGGINVITVDSKNRKVEVTEANCSNRKDCVHTPAIADNSGFIYCLPHAVRILPLNPEDGGNIVQ